MVPGIIYSHSDTPTDVTKAMQMMKTPYHEAIGSLMYISVSMHPNISYTVSSLLLLHISPMHSDDPR